MKKRSGITIAGSTIVDKIYEIPAYPALGELTQIASITTAMGGCVANVSLDLKSLCPEMDIRAAGLVGSDTDGDFYIKTLMDNGVETCGVRRVPGAITTCTHVMSIPGGQRTFFTYAGADADLCAADLDLDNVPSKILHLGYFLLLKNVDAGEGLEILKRVFCNRKVDVEIWKLEKKDLALIIAIQVSPAAMRWGYFVVTLNLQSF